MIRVRFDPATLSGADKQWWDAWAMRASAARKKVLDAVNKGKTPEFNDAIWKELKAKLLEWAFFKKCAYCESPVVDLADNPAAEHYRPKRTPTVWDAATKKEVAVEVNGATHPGYYWLAYEWRNLVPACSQCNSNGKGNAFPVANTHVVAHDDHRNDPSDLDVMEDPLLLHPYNHDPEKHLCFDTTGAVAARNADPRGETLIRCYRLHRGGLDTARAQAQEFAWMQIRLALVSDDLTAIHAKMAAYKRGELPYSRAVLDYVGPKLKRLRDGVDSAM